MICSAAARPFAQGSARSIVIRSGGMRGSATIACSAVEQTATTEMPPSCSSIRLSATAYASEGSQISTRVIESPADEPFDGGKQRLLAEGRLHQVGIGAGLTAPALAFLRP